MAKGVQMKNCHGLEEYEWHDGGLLRLSDEGNIMKILNPEQAFKLLDLDPLIKWMKEGTSILRVKWDQPARTEKLLASARSGAASSTK